MEVDPYYILGVSRGDDIKHITKEFKKRIHKVHPDKVRGSQEDKEIASRQFKIFLDAYETILSLDTKEKEQVGRGLRGNFEDYTVSQQQVQQVKFSECDLDKFNRDYLTKRPHAPNDFGYGEQTRLGQNLKEDDFKGKMAEYNSFNYQPTNVIGDKFDHREFNRIFEHNNSNVSQEESRGLIHKTTDGFVPFNCGDNGIASVSSYNGLMIVGDNFGESKVGYDTSMYGDYRHSFNTAMNPESRETPSDFRTSMERYDVDSRSLEKQMQERETEFERMMNTKHAKSFHEQEQELEIRQANELKNKIQYDTKFIEQYISHYPPETVEAARRGELDVSSDYIRDVDPTKTIGENLDNQRFRLQL